MAGEKAHRNQEMKNVTALCDHMLDLFCHVMTFFIPKWLFLLKGNLVPYLRTFNFHFYFGMSGFFNIFSFKNFNVTIWIWARSELIQAKRLCLWQCWSSGKCHCLCRGGCGLLLSNVHTPSFKNKSPLLPFVQLI